jgi:hypothetical protein
MEGFPELSCSWLRERKPIKPLHVRSIGAMKVRGLSRAAVRRLAMKSRGRVDAGSGAGANYLFERRGAMGLLF